MHLLKWNILLAGPLEQGGQGRGRLPSLNFSLNVPLFSKSPLDLPFLEEVAKNVDENQYSTWISKKNIKHNTLWLMGFYQVENIKFGTLLDSIKDSPGQTDDK